MKNLSGKIILGLAGLALLASVGTSSPGASDIHNTSSETCHAAACKLKSEKSEELAMGLLSTLKKVSE